MFPIPPNETLVETKVCKHCGISFPITDRDMEFYEKVSPVFSGKKYVIPTPQLCPDCRQQRRLSFRNERKLYKRTCDFSGKDIISIYSPDKPFKVYHQDYWWSDKWNPMDYGREFDFSKPFFEQFGELLREVPRLGLCNGNSCENCNYTNQIYTCKSCYLIFSCQNDKDCAYGKRLIDCNDCIDCLLGTGSSQCYQCIDISSCAHCFFSENLDSCQNIWYSDRCEGCEECILCSNLRNKKYCIKNIEYTEEEYTKKKKELLEMSYQDLTSIYQSHKSLAIKKYVDILSTENVIGDYTKRAQNCYFVCDASDIEDVKYGQFIKDINDSQDLDYCCCQSELSFEISTGGVNMYGCAFSVDIWPNVQNSFYSDSCSTSSHIFGCVGLRNKQYCILNRQYTKEEYEELVPRIIEYMMTTGEWGEFFPSSLSPFGYNETVAQEYFPMSREEVLNGHPELVSGSASVLGQKEDTEISSAGREVSLRGVEGNETTKQSSVPMVSASRTSGTSGSPHFVRDDKPKEDSDTFLHGPIFNWSDYESPFPKVDKIIPASKLPEDISSIPDDILNWAIECEVTGKPFRIIPQELEFYRKHHLPIPRRHPDQRHLDRMKMRNPRKLYERICDCPECEINNKTSLLSFSSNENPFGTRERDSPTENDKETVDTFVLNPRTRKRGKKMITTYSPERPERVYCEVCYEREVVG